MSGSDADPPVHPDDMDDDEALRYAIALSLQEQNPKEEGSNVPEETKPEVKPKGGFSMASVDRKAMEEARLQRLAAKRPRQTLEEDDDVIEVPPPKKRSAQPESPGSSHLKAVPTSSTGNTTDSHRLYLDGVVKKTWARGYPRTSDDIKIEEILMKDNLELAMLSSFQWDEEWMLSKIDIKKTRLLLLAFAADDAQKQEMQANAPPSIRFCFPPMNGPGAMHSKLQVLKFPDHLRIVIPTGNFVPYDWGESGVMENMVFLIDLPRLPDGTDHEHTMFSTEMARFLRESHVDEKMVDSLTNYDFSRTKKLGFVYSIPGSHTNDLRRRTGYCGLGDTVAALGLASTSPIEVDSVSASLGSLTCDLIGAIYNACQGDNGMKEYSARTTRKPAGVVTNPPPRLKKHFRIYFPTEQTVVNSRGGRGAAGTICIQAKWWRQPRFPTDLVRDCVSVRKGLLMHTKVVFVRPATTETTDKANEKPKSWVYVGSANLSESAWGRLVKDSKTSKPKMNCRNWECGVVVPVHEVSSDHDLTDQSPRQGKEAVTDTTTKPAKNELEDIFAPAIPVPMLVPGRQYGPNEEPWYYSGS